MICGRMTAGSLEIDCARNKKIGNFVYLYRIIQLIPSTWKKLLSSQSIKPTNSKKNVIAPRIKLSKMFYLACFQNFFIECKQAKLIWNVIQGWYEANTNQEVDMSIQRRLLHLNDKGDKMCYGI